jgi:hypothetical protein
MAKENKKPPLLNELDNLEKELKDIPVSSPKPEASPSPDIKKGAGRPLGSTKKKSDLDVQQQLLLDVLKGQKTQIINHLITSPVEGIKAYCKTRQPKLKDDIDKIWTISEGEKVQVQFWANMIFDLYMPDMVKHLKLIALIIGGLTIISVYLPRIIASVNISKQVTNEQPKTPEPKP